MTSLRVDEEEEAELALAGASLVLPSGARHYLPAPDPQRTGADETCPPVCIMKSSSWLTVSLPSSHCPHPLLPFFPPLHPPLLLLPKLLGKTAADPGAALRDEGAGRRGRGGRSAGSSLASVRGHMLIFSGSCPTTSEHIQIRGLGLFDPKHTTLDLSGDSCPAVLPYATKHGTEAPKLKNACPLSNVTPFSHAGQEAAAKHRGRNRSLSC